MSSEWRRDPATTNPTGHGWILAELRNIKEQLRALAARASINNATLTGLLRILGNVIISGVGRLTFTNGGSILARDHEGREYFYVGGMNTNGFGVLFTRLNGVQALAFIDDDPVNETVQRIRLMDSNGFNILAEDTSGEGIAWPQQPLTFTGLSWPTWDGADSGTFTPIARCVDFKRTRRFQMQVQHIADAGTIGEVRLMVNGVQVGPTVPVATLALNSTTFGTPALLAGDMGAAMSIELQARRISGTGLVRARVAWCFGFGS